MSDQLIPFHKQAEDIGTFVIKERAREAAESRRDDATPGPSENID